MFMIKITITKAAASAAPAVLAMTVLNRDYWSLIMSVAPWVTRYE